MVRRKGKTNPLLIVGLLILIVVVATGGDLKLPGKAPTPEPTPPGVPVSGITCQADDAITTLKLAVRNEENTSNPEFVETTNYVYKVTDGREQWIGSLNTVYGVTPSYQTINVDCTGEYVIKAVAGDGYDDNTNAKGNHSFYTGLSDPLAGVTITDGMLRVEANGRDTVEIIAAITEHSGLNFRAFDSAGDPIFFSENMNATAYQGANVIATNTTKCEGQTDCAQIIGTDEQLEVTLWIKGNNSAGDFKDKTAYLLVDADVSDWDAPDFTWNGIALAEMYDGLSADEKQAWNAYEYAYEIPTSIVDNPKISMDIYVPTCGGCNPTKNVTTAFASVGGYLSIDGTSVNYAGVKDDSSNTQVYTLQQVIWHVQ